MQAPSKETIEKAYHSKNTLRSYKTYQTQFKEYCRVHKNGLGPESASPAECTDFFHHLYRSGKKARTIDSAKTALVAFFNEKKITPNPAQDSETKRYVIGLQKYNKQNNIDEEKKAHPVSAFELSTIIDAFSDKHLFIGSMYRFLFSATFIDVFESARCSI